MRRGRALLLPVLLAALLLGQDLYCGPRTPKEAARTSAFEPPDGPVRSGRPAVVSARIVNTGAGHRTFFVGFSVRDPAGGWVDASPSPVDLGPGEESESIELRTPPLERPGYYDARLSVWSGRPGSEDARRIADRREASAFRVSSEREDFDAPNPEEWEATRRKLGRGRLLPENVSVEEGWLRLTLPEGGLDGAEIESRHLHGPGFYAARIKVPDAPSSITGFFLYAPPDLESEIDVEVFNDPAGKVLFTTYAGGEQTHTTEMDLPFDPSKDFHEYAFYYDHDSIVFYVDGEPMTTYEGGLPAERMKLYVNAWFPAWLEGRKPPSDRDTAVDWIEWQDAPPDQKRSLVGR